MPKAMRQKREKLTTLAVEEVIDIAEAARLHTEENLSVLALSVLFDVSAPWLKDRLEDAGVTVKRIRSVGKRHTGPITRELIRDLHRDEFLTVNQIGVKLGISRKRILNVLTDFGIDVPGEGPQLNELEKLPTSLWRCFERRSSQFRDLVRLARKKRIVLQTKDVGEGRVWVSRKGRFLHARYKAMRPYVEERKQSIRTMYEVDKLSGHAIAEMYQVSVIGIYSVLREAGLICGEISKFRVTRVAKSRLERLYLKQGLSVPAISSKLKIETRHIVRELKRHGIWKESREVKEIRFPGIERLKIGETMTIKWNPADEKEMRRESRWFNIRIIYRPLSSDTVKLIRTPHFTVEEVKKYHEKGLSTAKLARLFVAEKPKILAMKRIAGIPILKAPFPRK